MRARMVLTVVLLGTFLVTLGACPAAAQDDPFVDADHDGIVDAQDPEVTAPTTAPDTPPPPQPTAPQRPPAPTPDPDNDDSDGDGIPNILDPDDDNGGTDDQDDPAPNDPAIEPTEPTTILDPVADSDGDGILNVQDPDDDNGGTSDEFDTAPFDPTIEPTEPITILDPVADSDGDGIPNILDPDDDNDSQVDEQDAAPFDPVTPTPTSQILPTPTPATVPTVTPATVPTVTPRNGAGTGQAPSARGPAVLALPTTGAGASPAPIFWSVACGAASLGCLVLASRRSRHVRRAVAGVAIAGLLAGPAVDSVTGQQAIPPDWVTVQLEFWLDWAPYVPSYPVTITIEPDDPIPPEPFSATITIEESEGTEGIIRTVALPG